jgi:hypothetical protein
MMRQFVWKQVNGEIMHVVVDTDLGTVTAYNSMGKPLMRWAGLSPVAIRKVIQDFLELMAIETDDPLPF